MWATLAGLLLQQQSLTSDIKDKPIYIKPTSGFQMRSWPACLLGPAFKLSKIDFLLLFLSNWLHYVVQSHQLWPSLVLLTLVCPPASQTLVFKQNKTRGCAGQHISTDTTHFTILNISVFSISEGLRWSLLSLSSAEWPSRSNLHRTAPRQAGQGPAPSAISAFHIEPSADADQCFLSFHGFASL